MTALLVVGTGPAVGTTTVTSALAALAVDRGTPCTVVAPAETGLADGEPGSLARVTALAGGVRAVELARYPDLLSPAAAARRSGRAPLDPAAAADAVLSADRDSANRDRGLVLVDAPGGLLVRYDDDGFTVADLARTLRLSAVVVTAVQRGAANAAALTLGALAARGVALEGVVLTGWPTPPGPADECTLADLEMLAARPLLGVLPAESELPFLEQARTGLGPALGGSLDASAFRRQARP